MNRGEYLRLNRPPICIGEPGISHCLNVEEKNCTCGKWQDREYRCIDALAYFKIMREKT